MYGSSPFRSTLNMGYSTTLDMCEVCTEAVHCVALGTRVTLQLETCVKYVPKQSIPQHFEHGLHHNFGHVWSMYRSSPFRSTLNTGYITTLDMCEVCTEAVHSVALWTRVTLQLWTCVKFVRKQSIPQRFEHGLHCNFGHVWSMYRSNPFRSTLITGLHYNFGHVWSMYRSSPFRSTLNSGYITTLDMCEVCTEAVHSVALWTRVTLQLWTCVKYVSRLWILVECGTQSEVV